MTDIPHVKAYVRGTKVTLDILSRIAGGIPVPGLQVGIVIASQIVTVMEAIRTNREQCELITARLYEIITVIVTGSKGKAISDYPPGLATNLEKLTSVFLEIRTDLLKVQKYSNTTKLLSLTRLKSFVGYNDVTTQLADCSAKLDWAMQVFHVQAQVGDALRLYEAAENIKAVKEGTELTQVTVQAVHDEVQAVRYALQCFSLENAVPSLPPLCSGTLPPRPKILYGREDYVQLVVHSVSESSSPRFAVRGPGGIGKTCVGLAVVQHPLIIAKYEDRRHYVLARSLGIDAAMTDRLQAIISFLHADSRPRLILFDNFETPLNIYGQQSNVEDILCMLADIPHLSLLLTLRGTLPAVDRIEWTEAPLPTLEPLSPSASRVLYIRINPGAAADSSLDNLLEVLANIPLAIKLMANLGRLGESPKQLLNRWQSQGTDMLDGDDSRTSVNKSIEMSLQSQYIRRNPDALTLLSVISFLPGGVQAELLSSLVPSMVDAHRAKAALIQASLVLLDEGSAMITMLPPISRYFRGHYPLSSELLQDLCEFYFSFLAKHAPDLVKEGFMEDVYAISQEEVNVEACLTYSLQSGDAAKFVDSALGAAVSYAWYQRCTVPRTDLAILVLSAARKAKKDEFIAKLQERVGQLFFIRSELKEASKYFTQAKEGFDLIPQGSLIVSFDWGTLRGAWEITKRPETCWNGVKRSSLPYEILLGNACAFSVWLTSELSKVTFRKDELHLNTLETNFLQLEAYEAVRRTYQELGNPLGAASCLAALDDMAKLRGEYHTARSRLLEAQCEYDRLDNGLGSAGCLSSLAEMDYMESKYETAAASLTAAQERFQSIGNRLGVLSCTLRLAKIHTWTNKHEQSQAVLRGARQEYERLGEQVGAAQCLQSIAESNNLQGHYDDAWMQYNQARREFKAIGTPFGAAACLRSIALVRYWQIFAQGDWQATYGESRVLPNEAAAEFLALKNQQGVDGCQSIISLIDLTVQEMLQRHAQEGGR